MLEIQALSVSYGNIRALRGISLSVGRGEIVAIIGNNGAGKSTCLNAICGVVPLAEGTIHMAAEQISGLPTHVIISKGIAYVPEGRRIFTPLTVEENLLMGAFLQQDAGRVRRSMERVYDLFPRLKERRKQPAGQLSGGEQQMLATGRGLMSEPQLLLMDEPSMGLAPLLVREFFEIMQRINAEDGTTVLLVEQNVHLALNVADRAYVLESGEIVLSGAAAALGKDDAVRRAYLGII